MATRGPRTARGFTWKVGDVEYNVSTCEMSGGGYHPWEPSPGIVEESGYGPDEAEFEFDWTGGEISNVEFATVVGMIREPGQDWQVYYRHDRWTNEDEGNDPQSIARARLLAAVDSNGDGDVELAGYLLVDCRGRGFCEQRDKVADEPRFHLQVFANIDGTRAWQDIELEGTKVARIAEIQHQTMDPERMSYLDPMVEAHRDTALEQARAHIREEELP